MTVKSIYGEGSTFIVDVIAPKAHEAMQSIDKPKASPFQKYNIIPLHKSAGQETGASTPF
ncbi:MAG: hypothetical protein H0U75_02490 [Legionella sp.]|nr:hypothetical protein [Legionella sp.]